MTNSTAPFTVIGLAGYARAGKDTAAAPLIEDHGFKRLAFANGVRALAWELNPMLYVDGGFGARLTYRDAMEQYGQDWAKANTDVRDHLVAIGGGVRRVIGPNSWVEAVKTQMVRGTSYVITDVRYANEVEMIGRLGGEVWMVERPDVGPANEEERMSFEGVSPHRFIDNSGTVEDLHDEVEGALQLFNRRSAKGLTARTWAQDAGMGYSKPRPGQATK